MTAEGDRRGPRRSSDGRERDSSGRFRTRMPISGDVIGERYELGERIARGGMGVVHVARDLAIDREVAVKLLPPFAVADNAHERFVRECRTTAAVQHPCVIRIYDAGFYGDHTPYYVMERLHGITLGERIKTVGPLRLRAALRVTAAVCAGLQAAHEHGVIHRDVKPGNVFLTENPIGVVVFDFGLSLQQSDPERITDSGLVVGTPAYMAPEQITGDAVDARTDVYGIGAVLYHSVAGQRHLADGLRDVHQVFDAILHQSPAPLSQVRSGVTEAVDAIIAKALAKDPAHRFESAREMRVACDDAVAELDELGVR